MSVWLGSFHSKNPSMISRGEFGAVAAPRILEPLVRFEVPATFCIPGRTVLAYPDLVKTTRDGGHEITHHGWVHEDPAAFDLAGERANNEKGLEALETAAGVRPHGYRSPSWGFSENTVGVLREYGFAYDSSMMGDGFLPCYLREAMKRRSTDLMCSGATSTLSNCR